MSRIKIGIIGDYRPESPSHNATNEALHHCAAYSGIDLDLEWLPTRTLEENAEKCISGFDGLWCSPGVYESTDGAINAIKFAREKDHPLIGTCAGFQFMVIEYARNKLGLRDAAHAEFDPDAKNLIITPLSCSLVGKTSKVLIAKASRLYEYYKETEVEERFTCRFGINPVYQKLIDESGFKIAASDENDEIRVLDLVQNRFYTATLFQPQLSSLPTNPHKLILAYLNSVKEFHIFKE